MTKTQNARIAALRTRAKASRFISSLDDLKPCRVVIYARASRSHQRKHLPQQVANLQRELEARGFIVIAVFIDLGSGWQENRIPFERAIMKAKEAGAVLVAESVDRFRRCWPLPGERKTPPLNTFELQHLVSQANGVRLATLLHPDASPAEVRSHQTKRGKNHSRTGRKKVTRLAKLPEAKRLRRMGLSYRQIGEKIGVHWATVHGWIRKSSYTRV